MKAILVIDMPNDMNVEETKALNVTLFNGLFVKELKIDCPLRPLPQKKVGDDLYERYGSWTIGDEKELSYRVGFNDCIDEILGEEK